VEVWLETVHQALSVTAEVPQERSKYHDDPVGFARDCIDWRGGGLTAYQNDILTAVPREKRVSARGPHGLGKTTTAAVLVLWFATTREMAGMDWKVATTAGAWRQLEKYLWPEIRKWAGRIRWDVLGMAKPSERTELLTLNIKFRHGQAFAVASDEPALIEGVHADAVLYVFDESKAIIPGTFDAAEGAFSGAGGEAPIEAFAVAMSTPGEPNGRFYDIHARKPGLEDWWTRHVTVDEAIAAGRVSAEWVAQRGKQWGTDSAIYANRVLGEFHTSDKDGVIPLEWIEAANERWRAWDEAGQPVLEGPKTTGVDVAREGGDQTVLALRRGDVITELRRFSKAATTETTGHVVGILNANPGMVAIVDVIGVGGGVVDQLREQKLPVEAFNASAATEAKDRSDELGFVNTRAAAWWNLRERLDPAYGATLALPADDALTGDLTAPRWKVTSGGKIQIESKDDIRKRIGRSPDDGDAVMQAVWESPGDAASAFLEALRQRAGAGELTVTSSARDWRETAANLKAARTARTARAVGAPGGQPLTRPPVPVA
jgi:hypothetical protein